MGRIKWADDIERKVGLIDIQTPRKLQKIEVGETLPSVPDGFYTSPEEALLELRRRLRDFRLRKKVQESLGNIPKYLQEKPKATLGRFIATPNYEMFRFLNLARELEMEPVVTELLRDKFCTRNPDKLSLGHMPFYRGKDKCGRTSFEYQNVCDCTKYQGKELCDMMAYSGESLINLHHRLLYSCADSSNVSILADDFIYFACGRKPKLYYLNFLTRFICHGILFENFVTNKDEYEFFSNVVFPIFIEITEQFGVKPLIVSLLPDDTASDVFWRCYPYYLKENALRITKDQNTRIAEHSMLF